MFFIILKSFWKCVVKRKGFIFHFEKTHFIFIYGLCFSYTKGSLSSTFMKIFCYVFLYIALASTLLFSSKFHLRLIFANWQEVGKYQSSHICICTRTLSWGDSFFSTLTLLTETLLGKQDIGPLLDPASFPVIIAWVSLVLDLISHSVLISSLP